MGVRSRSGLFPYRAHEKREGSGREDGMETWKSDGSSLSLINQSNPNPQIPSHPSHIQMI